ncbi:hypothetical protein GT613_15235 [Eggerthella sp. BIOML-A4]|nr:hypothetical protein [Eggerthella sp. BIOML-A4]MZK29700.1 hypothetical protein [Eggerthella sp. BIOML-A4]
MEKKMNKPQIARVDRDMYESGRRLPHLWSIGNELKFYRVTCNWGLNHRTQHFYHVLAYSWEQAKDMARSEYARTHYISKDWVKIY